MSQPAAPANLNIRVFTQSGPKAELAHICKAWQDNDLRKLTLSVAGALMFSGRPIQARRWSAMAVEAPTQFDWDA
jgi:hypothetical protein